MTARALLIGINYFDFDCELKGCINDANNMLRWLGSIGYDEFELLVDSPSDPDWKLPNAPTRANILRAITRIVSNSKEGDTIFFHFSGHGSQLTDDDGDEADGLDECICPADSLLTCDYITDDVLREYLIDPASLRGVKVRMVLDCCHSGTGADLPWIWVWGNTVRADCSKTGKQKLVPGYVGGDPNDPKLLPADVICISGCKDAQTSADATFIENGRAVSGGALTTGFLKVVGNNTDLVNWGSLMKKIKEELGQRFRQIPQLSSADKFATGKPVSWK